MTAVMLGHYTPGSEEWLDARRSRLGGSEIAAVLGLSPYESRFSLWHRKKGAAGQQPEKPEMEWGKRLEPVVLAKFIEGHPGEWSPAPGSYVHAARSWQVASPDALLNLHGHPAELAEVKTSPYGDGWGEPFTDEIPVYYRAQCLWYADTLGVDTIHVAVLIGGCDYREYLLTVDATAEADIAVLRSEGERFIADLADDRRPDIDAHPATHQVVRALHPEIEPEDVEVDAEVAGEYLAAVMAEREAKTDKQLRAARVLDAMGRARNGCVDGVRFAYRTARDPGTPYLAPDRKRLAQLTHPQTIREASTA